MTRFLRTIDRLLWHDRYDHARSLGLCVVAIVAVIYFGHAAVCSAQTYFGALK